MKIYKFEDNKLKQGCGSLFKREGNITVCGEEGWNGSVLLCKCCSNNK